MSKGKYNKSKTYLLPLLAEVIDLDLKFYNNIVNTYIYDVNNNYKDCFFILHDFSFRNPEFTAYEHKLTNSPYFIELVDIDNKVLYIYKFPEEYLPEYNNFKIGKYSQYGKDAKEILLNFFGTIYSGNLNAIKFLMTLKQVLFKDEKLKLKLETELKVTLPPDAELTDIMVEENETFDVTNIK